MYFSTWKDINVCWNGMKNKKKFSLFQIRINSNRVFSIIICSVFFRKFFKHRFMFKGWHSHRPALLWLTLNYIWWNAWKVKTILKIYIPLCVTKNIHNLNIMELSSPGYFNLNFGAFWWILLYKWNLIVICMKTNF